MIINFFVILMVLGLAFVWATYGLFSSFLHLVCVFLSCVVALAFWEPVAHILLGWGWSTAWGVGLLAPFVVSLWATRMGVDLLVKGNMDFDSVVNQAGGGILGVITGVLTTGMLVIGVGYAWPNKTIIGVQPYALSGESYVDSKNDSSLWLPVDTWTAGVLSTLSKGGFAPSFSSYSLDSTYPDLASKSHQFRLTKDRNVSRVLSPDAVRIKEICQFEINDENMDRLVAQSVAFATVKRDELVKGPQKLSDEDGLEIVLQKISARMQELRDAERQADEIFDVSFLGQMKTAFTLGDISELDVLQRLMDYQDKHYIPGDSSMRTFLTKLYDEEQSTFKDGYTLVWILTDWTLSEPNTVDGSMLRLERQQAMLRVEDGTEYWPVAWSARMLGTKSMYARHEMFNVDQTTRSANLPSQGQGDKQMGLCYLIPKDAKLSSLHLRNLRFNLSDQAPKAGLTRIAEVSGVYVPVIPDDDTVTLEANQLAVGKLEVSNRLPVILSAASLSEKEIKIGARESVLLGGDFYQKRFKGLVERRLRTRFIKVSSESVRMLRLEMTYDQVQTAWDHGMDVNNGGESIMLVGNGGVFSARGMIVQRSSLATRILMDPGDLSIVKEGIKGSHIANLEPMYNRGDKVYIYFEVPVEEEINEVSVGGRRWKVSPSFKLRGVPVQN